MGVHPLVVAMILLATTLAGLLPPRHPVLVCLIVAASALGAATAEQGWAMVGWGAIGVAAGTAWAIGALMASTQRSER